MAIEHNGDIYSCDHFVYSENKLGNLMEESLQAKLLIRNSSKILAMIKRIVFLNIAVNVKLDLPATVNALSIDL